MRSRFIGAFAGLAGLAALPLAAQSQGIPGGAAGGAEAGGQIGGAAGAAAGGVIGGAVGGVTGAAAGILGIDQRPRFREYVIREHRSVYRLTEPVRVGMVLPPDAHIAFYAIPHQFGALPGYRYAVINDEVVLVEPSRREIVDIID
jgi:hypothetical protein